MAKELKVKPSTISRWRTNLDLDNRAAREIRKRLFEYLPDVYEALATKAKEGSSRHIDLFLKVALDHQDAPPITTRRSTSDAQRATRGTSHPDSFAPFRKNDADIDLILDSLSKIW